MRAIIVATGNESVLATFAERYPAPMLPLVDRPFLQHLVEFLVAGHVKRLEFVLSHLPEKIEGWFGDGARWGGTFTYHLARQPDRPYNTIKAICPDGDDEPILLVSADRLPLDEMVLRRPTSSKVIPIAFGWRTDTADEAAGSLQWTGWAWVSPAFIDGLPVNLGSEEFQSLCLRRARANGRLIEVAEPLSVQSPADLLRSQRRVLCREVSGVMLDGQEVEPGVWLSRNVSLPPSVAIAPPVHIGANCCIGQRVELGPNAVLGEGSFLDDRCSVRDTLVCPGSFVGRSLELADVVLDRNCLLNARLGIACHVSEDFIVGAMRARPLHDWLAGGFSRISAAVLLGVTWPVLLLTAGYLKILHGGQVLYKTEFVQLPAPSDPSSRTVRRRWSFSADGQRSAGSWERVSTLRHLLLELLPSLPSIVVGGLHFVGVHPRSNRQLDRLPKDWRELVLGSKAGIVSEAFVQFGDRPSDDEVYSADAFYCVNAGVRHDLKLMLGYLGRVLSGAATSEGTVTANEPAADQKAFSSPGGIEEETYPMADDLSGTNELETYSDPIALEQIRAFISSVCRELVQPPMNEESTYKVVVSVQEVAANIMRHAYGGRSDGEIRFLANVQPERLTIDVSHHGKGFDPQRVAEPIFDGSREGGFGVYIVARYMDDVQYFSDEQGAHRVSLVANLSGG